MNTSRYSIPLFYAKKDSRWPRGALTGLKWHKGCILLLLYVINIVYCSALASKYGGMQATVAVAVVVHDTRQTLMMEIVCHHWGKIVTL